MTTIERLADFVRSKLGCDASWVESISVAVTTVAGRTWSGSVELFALAGHCEASSCFAWNHDDSPDGWKPVVFATPPILLASDAVRIALMTL